MCLKFLFSCLYRFFYRDAFVEINHIYAKENGILWKWLCLTVLLSSVEEIPCIPNVGGNEGQQLFQDSL